jgi:hypothetical protein
MNFDVEPHTSYMEYYIYIKAADYSHDEWWVTKAALMIKTAIHGEDCTREGKGAELLYLVSLLCRQRWDVFNIFLLLSYDQLVRYLGRVPVQRFCIFCWFMDLMMFFCDKHYYYCTILYVVKTWEDPALNSHTAPLQSWRKWSKQPYMERIAREEISLSFPRFRRIQHAL